MRQVTQPASGNHGINPKFRNTLAKMVVFRGLHLQVGVIRVLGEGKPAGVAEETGQRWLTLQDIAISQCKIKPQEAVPHLSH